MDNENNSIVSLKKSDPAQGQAFSGNSHEPSVYDDIHPVNSDNPYENVKNSYFSQQNNNGQYYNPQTNVPQPYGAQPYTPQPNPPQPYGSQPYNPQPNPPQPYGSQPYNPQPNPPQPYGAQPYNPQPFNQPGNPPYNAPGQPSPAYAQYPNNQYIYNKNVAQTNNNDSAGLILGVISIVACSVPVIGGVLGGLGLGLSSGAKKKSAQLGLPESSNAKAGFICSLIGLIINIVVTLFLIVCIVLGVLFGDYSSSSKYNDDDGWNGYHYYDDYDEYYGYDT